MATGYSPLERTASTTQRLVDGGSKGGVGWGGPALVCSRLGVVSSPHFIVSMLALQPTPQGPPRQAELCMVLSGTTYSDGTTKHGNNRRKVLSSYASAMFLFYLCVSVYRCEHAPFE